MMDTTWKSLIRFLPWPELRRDAPDIRSPGHSRSELAYKRNIGFYLKCLLWHTGQGKALDSSRVRSFRLIMGILTTERGDLRRLAPRKKLLKSWIGLRESFRAFRATFSAEGFFWFESKSFTPRFL